MLVATIEYSRTGGGGGIRTPGRLAPSPDFELGHAFNAHATLRPVRGSNCASNSFFPRPCASLLLPNILTDDRIILMGTFTTNLKLGSKAFAVDGYQDACVVELTVGQLRIQQTLPDCNKSSGDDPCYMEVAMCIETGVGSGTLWKYGETIFANRADAEAGVVRMHQKFRKERAAKDAYQAEQDERLRATEMQQLKRLKEKYEGTHIGCVPFSGGGVR